MKKPWSILKMVIVGVVAFVGGGFLLAGLFVVMLLLGGPYSDAQFSPKSYSPIANITIVPSSMEPLWWIVDERFVVEFDNGFVLRQGANLSNLPESFTASGGGEDRYTGKVLTAYRVREMGAGDDNMSVYVDEDKNIVRADFSSGLHCKAEFKDLKSQKSIRLCGTSAEDLIKFFKSLPK